MSTWNLDALLENTPWQGVPEADFLDWRWQVNRTTTFEELAQLYKQGPKTAKALFVQEAPFGLRRLLIMPRYQ